MENRMEIRELEVEAVGAVVELWGNNWAEVGESGPTPKDRERLRSVLNGYVSHPQVCCFVAEQDGQVVGFVTASISSHPVMEGLAGTIEELYVRPASRRQSIGSQLAQRAVSFLRDSGAGVARTHACVDSEVARVFWRSLGWEADLATLSLYNGPE
jgi:ribosomal protein S18 acetylase RimI-like enzyme